MKTAKRVCGIVSTLLLILLVVCAAILVGPALMGYRSYTVLSPSMEPTYRVGSLILAKPVEASSIQVGDAITFYVESGSSVVATHRVVSIDTEKQQFRTKGDNNPKEDPSPVSFQQLVGRTAAVSFPYFGNLSQFLQTAYGKTAAVGIFLFIVLLLFLPDWLFGGKQKKEQPSSPEGEGQTAEQAKT